MKNKNLTGGPDVSRLLLVLDDEVEDVAAVVPPKVQLQADEGRVGQDELLALGRTSRTASQGSCGQDLAEILIFEKWFL